MYPKGNYKYLDYLLMFGGLYVPPSTSKKSKKYFFYGYNTFFIVICQFYLYPAELVKIPESMKTLESLVEHAGMLLNHTLCIFKMIIYAWSHSRVIKIREKLERDEFKYESCETYDPAGHMYKCRRFHRGLTVFFFIFGTMVPLSKELRYFGIAYRGWRSVGNGTVVCQDILPYFSWFPFETEYPMGCVIAYFVQWIPLSFYIYQIIAVDGVLVTITIYIRGHLVNVRGAFRTMRKRCLVRIGLPMDYEVLYDTDEPLIEKEISIEVRKMTVHLQELLEICNEMELVFKYMILGQVLTVLLALVPCLYIISTEELFSPIYMAQMQMAGGISSQILCFSALGTELTDNCSAVSDGIYESDWYSCTEPVKNTLIINTMRLQKPVYYTVGGFSPLMLGTFVQIVKGSYSYYTVLTQK